MVKKKNLVFYDWTKGECIVILGIMSGRKSGLEQFIGGLGVFAVCAVLFFTNVFGVWVIGIGVFLGAFPMIKGARMAIREWETKRQAKEEQLQGHHELAEHAVLLCASRNKGKVTAMQVALDANIPISESDQLLQEMAARGYAEMRIRENGTIEYVFQELLS